MAKPTSRSCQRASLIAAGLLIALLQSGCAADAFPTVRQGVQLRIISRPAGRPVEHAYVQFAHVPQEGADERAWLDKQGQFSSRTNADGRATVPAEWSWILPVPFGPLSPSLLGPDGDMRRDRVSGKDYLCRVEDTDGSDIIRVNLTPGTVADGRLYSVQIESIGKAQPVEPLGWFLGNGIQRSYSVHAIAHGMSFDVSQTRIRELVRHAMNPARQTKTQGEQSQIWVQFSGGMVCTWVRVIPEPPALEVIQADRWGSRTNRCYLIAQDELDGILQEMRADHGRGCNAALAPEIEQTCRSHGVAAPRIVTPEQLLEAP